MNDDEPKSLDTMVQEMIARWDSTPPLAVRAPALGELLGGMRAQPWLEREAGDLLACDRPYDAIVGAGMIARLWTPQSPRPAMSRILAGDTPSARAEAWVRSLSPDVIRAAEHAASFTLDELLVRLSVELHERSFVLLPESALAWIHLRDDLESLRYVTRSVWLKRALDDMDRAALRIGWPRIDDDRCWDVSWQEPESWWGSLVYAET